MESRKVLLKGVTPKRKNREATTPFFILWLGIENASIIGSVKECFAKLPKRALGDFKELMVISMMFSYSFD